MANDLLLRPIEPHDGPAIGDLIVSSPSAGLISFTYDYQADVLEVNEAFASDLHGIVTQYDAKIIGMVLGDRLRIQLGGAVCDAVYVSNMRVHPHHRRKGVARGLSDYGLEYTGNLFGSDSVLYAAIPDGNVSLALMRAYQFQSTAPIQGGIVPVRNSPPDTKPGLDIRTATEDDLNEIAAGMNRFYHQHNLWSPITTSDLRRFLEKEVAGISPNSLYVVTRDDDIVGGLSVSDRSNLVRMKLSKTPFIVRLLGALLGVLPKSGILEALTIRRVWFAEGDLDAARHLWQHLRYQLRDRGSSLGIAYDPRDALADVFQIPFWLPMFKARYAIKTSRPLDPERLTYCVAGP